MIENIDANQVQDVLGKSSFKQPDTSKTVPSRGADVSLQVRYASLINKATQIPQTDTRAVEQARELVRSGQLESPANIRAAAESISTSGV